MYFCRMRELYYSNWPIYWLREPRSPTICHLWAEEPEKLMVVINSKSKGWWCVSCSEWEREPGALMSKDRRRWRPQLKQRGFPHTLPFCSLQTLSGLDNAHIRWWGQVSFLSLMIQMQYLSRRHPHRYTELSGHSLAPSNRDIHYRI